MFIRISKTQDEIWDFFKKLPWDTYEFEQAKNNFGYPTSNEFVFMLILTLQIIL